MPRDAGRGSGIYNHIYRHIYKVICATLHTVSTAEIQCTDFCKIEPSGLQNSTTTQPETLHLKSRDPGGIWNCVNNCGYGAQLALTAVLVRMCLNRPHAPNCGGDVKVYGDDKNGAAGRCGRHKGIIGATWYRRAGRRPSEWAGYRDPLGRGPSDGRMRAFPAGGGHGYGPGGGDGLQAGGDHSRAGGGDDPMRSGAVVPPMLYPYIGHSGLFYLFSTKKFEFPYSSGICYSGD